LIVRDQPIHWPFRAHFDLPLAAAITWAFDACATHLSTETGGILSALLDALRSSENELPPQDPRPRSLEEGFLFAIDRVGRLAYAVQQRPNTAAIVLQSTRDEVLFLCATGDPGEPLLFERTGGYADAARTLAQALCAEVDQPTNDGRAQLAGLGRAAFNALPLRVRELVSRRQVLLFVPDFRSDQDSIPFELFHDGTDFLGITKVVARSLSLREMVRSLEPPVLSLPHRKRAVCIAASHVQGFDELLFADWEVEQIRGTLEADDWEVPPFDERTLRSDLFLDAGELASVVHIAAHGEVYAGSEALVLSDNERVIVSDIERKPQLLRAFVFLNTCSLGRSRYLGGGISRGIAYALVRAGAPSVIANLQSVYDRSASLLSTEFFDQATGSLDSRPTVGETLRLARIHMDKKGVSPTHWATTVLIGDPFYLLPEESAGQGDATARDAASALLEKSDPFAATDSERVEAWMLAEEVRTLHPNHRRLAAALIWMAQLAALPPEDAGDPHPEESLARLAREIGHPGGEALLRLIIADRKEAKDREQRAEELEAAIAALEPLAPKSHGWWYALLRVKADYKRLSVPKEPAAFNAGGARVNDRSDPAIRAIFDVQHMVDLEELRHRRKVGPRLPERGLADLAWNAVVLGQQDRFQDEDAQFELTTLLVNKLLALGLCVPEGKANALRIGAGILPFLWRTQRITHLEWERATGQTGAFRLAMESALTSWLPPETSPAFPLVSPVEAQLDSTILSRQREALSKYARAALLLEQGEMADEFTALEESSRSAFNACKAISPQCLADGVAWVLGLLLEKCYTVRRNQEEVSDIMSGLRRVYKGLFADTEGWFIHYLVGGYAGVGASLELFQKWLPWDTKEPVIRQ
jgi:hypothetical protein